jgi:hypothetical protein
MFQYYNYLLINIAEINSLQIISRNYSPHTEKPAQIISNKLAIHNTGR